MQPLGTENLKSNKPDLYFGATEDVGLELQAELRKLLLTVEVMNCGNTVGKY